MAITVQLFIHVITLLSLIFYLTIDEELSAQEVLGAHESLDTERITRADGQKGGGGRHGVGGGEMGNTQKGVQTNLGPDSEAVNHTPDQISISSDIDKRGKVNTNVGGKLIMTHIHGTQPSRRIIT